MTPDGDNILTSVSTARLYGGNSKPIIRKSRQSDSTPALENLDSEEIVNTLFERENGDRVITAGPRCSGVFSIFDKSSSKAIGKARSGHTYSSLLGVSPCGEYIAYVVPGAFWNHGKVFIHHWDSRKRAFLDVSPRWQLKSWN
ncbi:MAG: hypothetical protein MI923_03535 [Phycisphaerales bacterium]|nr:hypothetical protein [Phycisphaerales bacterium]